MAILISSSKWRTGVAFATVALLVALAGCALFEGSRSIRRTYAFSHRVHAALELACTDCHLAAETGDRPGLPGVGACKLCHAELDAAKPADHHVESLFDGKEFRATKRGAVGSEVVFPHLRHVAAGVECNACHTGMETNDDVLDMPAASMDACSSCHESRHVVDDCATCHATIRADVAPPSHDAQWTRIHGGVCRAGAERTSDRCVLCHKESDCATCHATTPPENHTNQWRRVGHGLSAQFDRQTCATCHVPDSCNSCHSQSQPLSHTGAFGSPLDNHCVVCHEPLQGEGCATCHAGTPSHALAQPKPAGHTPAMDCRQCHLLGGTLPPMPHVDDGSNCNRCHH